MKSSESDFKSDRGYSEFLSNIKSSYTESSEENLFFDVDKRAVRPNDRRMTDLTRQQVTDLLAASESKVNERLANFDASIKTGFSELATAMAKQSAAIEKQSDALRIEMAQIRTEMAKQSGDMRTDVANVRSETHRGTVDTIKWVIGTIVGVAVATVSILTFVINNALPKASPLAASQQQTPTIITLPAGSAVLSAPQAPATTPAK